MNIQKNIVMGLLIVVAATGMAANSGPANTGTMANSATITELVDSNAANVSNSGSSTNSSKSTQVNSTNNTASNSGNLGTSTLPTQSNLNNIDRSAEDLNQLNRKLAIEKAKAELKKTMTGETNSNVKRVHGMENMQTVVTGVAINSLGRKIAWLQFADGGSLTVNVGSSVGKYVVTDITMSGVTLSKMGIGRHAKSSSIFLKRSYAALNKPKNSNVSNQGLFSAPSPILTDANRSGGSDDVMVPPIMR